MNDDPIEDLRTGVVGTFQPLLTSALPGRFTGHIQLGADGIEIAVIAGKEDDPRASWATDEAVHSVIAGITEVGSILMPVNRWRQSTTRGDLVVPVVRWFGSSILVDVETDEVDGDTVSSTSLQYYGLGSWAGSTDTFEEPIIEDEKRVGWRMEVRDQSAQRVDLDDSFTLVLRSTWTLGGQNDRRSITTPLQVSVHSETRQPLDEHLRRLDAVHALLSLAHKQEVIATRGNATLDQGSRHRAQLWDRTMIDPSIDPVTNSFPVFELGHMNDLVGVAAWIRVCLAHQPAVDPIVQHRLLTNQRPEARLLSTAAALEYWSASHARTHEWARGITSKFYVPHRVATTVSAQFDAWVGGTERWADLFSHTYSQLKHDPVKVDPTLASAVEIAGRWLLTASILDECAEHQSTSAHIFKDGLAYPMGHNLREVFGSAPTVPRDRKPRKPRERRAVPGAGPTEQQDT